VPGNDTTPAWRTAPTTSTTNTALVVVGEAGRASGALALLVLVSVCAPLLAPVAEGALTESRTHHAPAANAIRASAAVMRRGSRRHTAQRSANDSPYAGRAASTSTGTTVGSTRRSSGSIGEPDMHDLRARAGTAEEVRGKRPRTYQRGVTLSG